MIEHVFRTMLSTQHEMTEKMKTKHGREALLFFQNFIAGNKGTHEDVLNKFWRKYFRSQSKATGIQKWRKLTSDPNTKSLPDFLADPNNSKNVPNEHAELLHKSGQIVYCTPTYPSSHRVNISSSPRKRHIRQNNCTSTAQNQINRLPASGTDGKNRSPRRWPQQ